MTQPAVLHASSVAFPGPDTQCAPRGVLILGASGRGKSTLALTLLGMGAELVADDRTGVSLMEEHLYLSAPATIRNRIEARGVGILRCPAVAGAVPLALVVDLDQPETDRLPPERIWHHSGIAVPCMHGAALSAAFAMAVKLYAVHGRAA